MARWVFFVAGGGIVLLGILAKVGGVSKTLSPATPAPTTTARPAPPPQRPRPGIDPRLLSDDALTPPPLDAPESEWKSYEQTLLAIQKGQDPLLGPPGAPPRPQGNHESGKSKHDEMEKRSEERRKKAEERMKEVKERNDAHVAEMKKKHEEMKAKQDPNRPVGPPLIPPPDLGPPLSGVASPSPSPKP